MSTITPPPSDSPAPAVKQLNADLDFIAKMEDVHLTAVLLEHKLRNLIETSPSPHPFNEADHRKSLGELKANLTLAMRHSEDSQSRIDKAIKKMGNRVAAEHRDLPKLTFFPIQYFAVPDSQEEATLNIGCARYDGGIERKQLLVPMNDMTPGALPVSLEEIKKSAEEQFAEQSGPMDRMQRLVVILNESCTKFGIAVAGYSSPTVHGGRCIIPEDIQKLRLDLK